MLRGARAVILVGFVTLIGGVLGAQSSVTPFLGDQRVAENETDILRREGSARRAMELGFSSVAAGMWQSLVEDEQDPARRDGLILAWVIALLEDERVVEAASALEQLEDPSTSQARLREGLVALARGESTSAELSLAGVEVGELPRTEVSWYYYLSGALAHQREEFAAAREAFTQAIASATSGLQRARFELADLRTTWRENDPTAEQLATLERRMEQYAGERVGFDASKRYAAVLAALGRDPEAVTFLQNRLLTLPPAERQLRDDLRLLLGMIAGGGEGVGRNALIRLLSEGEDRNKQRIALRMLARASVDSAANAELRSNLELLLQEGSSHPIEEDLILFRAHLATSSGEATRDALMLLERFPASDLRTAALGILVSSAWEDQRFRAAAGYAVQARRELGDREAEVRAQLGILQADAFFRGGDYRSAADAYAAALDEPVAGVNPGDLIFQEVLARIRDRQLDAAADRIDLLAQDPRFDVINRWQAEWNLARALQAANRVVDASTRINRVMAGDAEEDNLPVGLAVRIAWLQARLALESGDALRALELAPAMAPRLETVEPELRPEVASSLRLMEAEAHFTLSQRNEALAVLQALREAYPDSDAAVFSFIEEAGAEANQGQLVKAQQLLAELIQSYPDSRYAPYALYQSALLAESRREEDYLKEAVNKIEQLVTTYPDSDLVFYARFKQGDVYRQMGLWEPARLVYDAIIREFPDHNDIWSAQMALADCLAAQAGSDPTLHESAAAIYERLRDVASASAELRIEAGYKAGSALARRGRTDRAGELWWQVVDDFLISPIGPEDLGTRGRYWLARILAQLGETLEAQDKLDDARRAYALIRDRGLPQADWAATQLARLGGVPVSGIAPVVDE